MDTLVPSEADVTLLRMQMDMAEALSRSLFKSRDARANDAEALARSLQNAWCRAYAAARQAAERAAARAEVLAEMVEAVS